MRFPYEFELPRPDREDHESRDTNDMSRAPVWRTAPEQGPRRPTVTPEEHRRWEVLLHQAMVNPEELFPGSPSGTPERQFTASEASNPLDIDENGGGDERMSEDSHGDDADDEGGSDSSGSSLESYDPPSSSGSETLSDSSYEWDSGEEEIYRAQPRPHNERLRGVVDGVVYEYDLQQILHSVRTDDALLPLVRCPLNFYWVCCGARFGQSRCLRVQSPPHEASGYVSPSDAWPFLP